MVTIIYQLYFIKENPVIEENILLGGILLLRLLNEASPASGMLRDFQVSMIPCVRVYKIPHTEMSIMKRTRSICCGKGKAWVVARNCGSS